MESNPALLNMWSWLIRRQSIKAATNPSSFGTKLMERSFKLTRSFSLTALNQMLQFHQIGNRPSWNTSRSRAPKPLKEPKRGKTYIFLQVSAFNFSLSPRCEAKRSRLAMEIGLAGVNQIKGILTSIDHHLGDQIELLRKQNVILDKISKEKPQPVAKKARKEEDEIYEPPTIPVLQHQQIMCTGSASPCCQAYQGSRCNHCVHHC
jgi:hypothetical protein